MAIVCPITNTNKGFPLHVILDSTTTTQGVIMCEQVKSLDIQARRAMYLEKTPRVIIDEVIEILQGSIDD